MSMLQRAGGMEASRIWMMDKIVDDDGVNVDDDMGEGSAHRDVLERAVYERIAEEARS